jgi:hypothetical protein
MGLPEKCGERCEWNGWSAVHAAIAVEKFFVAGLSRPPPPSPYRSNWRSGRLSGTGTVPLPSQSTLVWDPGIACPTMVGIECKAMMDVQRSAN